MRGAHQPQVLECRGTAERMSELVMQLQESTTRAASPLTIDESAPEPVADRDCSPDLVRDMLAVS
jgi:hypothetical protein